MWTKFEPVLIPHLPRVEILHTSLFVHMDKRQTNVPRYLSYCRQALSVDEIGNSTECKLSVEFEQNSFLYMWKNVEFLNKSMSFFGLIDKNKSVSYIFKAVQKQDEFFQSKTHRDFNFSHIFISNTEFELLYKRGGSTQVSNTPQNSFELCTI